MFEAWYEIAGVVVVVLLLLYVFIPCNKRRSVAGRHFLVTGGSKGIGLAFCKELVLKKATTITLLARNKAALEAAKKELLVDAKTLGVSLTVNTLSVDTTDYPAVQAAVKTLATNVDVLVCCAGLSLPGYFLDQDPAVFQKQMNVNYMGTVHAIKAVLPSMVASRTTQQPKDILIVSSGICAGSFLGYSSYAPTKFALRGLADALRNELLGFGISVSIAFPPDTETPGFENEEKTKPKETSLITPPALYKPQVVALDMLTGFLAGDYQMLSPNFETALSLKGNTGVGARRDVLGDALLAPIWVISQHFWRVFHADPTAAKYGQNYKKSK